MTVKSEIRMSKSEINPNTEGENPKRRRRHLRFPFLHSDFGFWVYPSFLLQRWNDGDEQAYSLSVMTPPLIEPSDFVATVQPLLERQDAAGLLELVRTRWTADQLKAILECDDLDARKVACLALALCGEKCCIPCVAGQLRHPDTVVNQMAEHALWMIWFRCGTEEANKELCRGTRCLNRRDLPC